MKTQILFLISGLLVAHSSFADTGMEAKKPILVQPPVQKTFTPNESPLSLLTPQIGINIANISGGSTSWNSTTGLSIGATVDLGRSNFVFETGLLYRQEGAKVSDSFYDVTLDLDYLAIPLLAKFYFNGAENNSMFVKFGGLPNILVAKKYDAGGYSGDLNGASSFVLDAMVGLGGKFKVSDSNDLIVELTYSRSLTNIATSGSNLANSVIGIDFGFGFEL